MSALGFFVGLYS